MELCFTYLVVRASQLGQFLTLRKQTERRFISQVLSTNNKDRAQRKSIRCMKLSLRKDKAFGAPRVV